MDELKKILQEHGHRYPKMEPTDAVKLIYQNEFGGGHLIRDEEACLRYLAAEYAATEKDPAMTPLEHIGNGMVRVNLAALKEQELAELGENFIRSAANHQGTREGFLAKLKVLEELTQEGVFSFDSAQLAAYLKTYEAIGYPPVSHSETYRTAYHPAYRVVEMQKA